MYTEKRNSEISDQEKLRAGVVGLGMIGGGPVSLPPPKRSPRSPKSS